MPRRREVAKRVILPDPKYNDRLVAKFMNVVMLSGKKSTAEQIVYGAFDLIQQRSGDEPVCQRPVAGIGEIAGFERRKGCPRHNLGEPFCGGDTCVEPGNRLTGFHVPVSPRGRAGRRCRPR